MFVVHFGLNPLLIFCRVRKQADMLVVNKGMAEIGEISPEVLRYGWDEVLSWGCCVIDFSPVRRHRGVQ